MFLFMVMAGLTVAQVATTGQTRPNLDLLNAAKLAELARARELVGRGAAVNTADWRGYTPLMWASASGHVETARYFLENGARVEGRAKDGTTALMVASANGSLDMVRLLLSRGANVSASRAGMTARQLAASRGHAEVAALLEQAEALGARLLQAAGDGHEVLVRQLLALGAPFNVTTAQGVTPLMLSARNGQLGMLQFLLSRGADAGLRDNEGLTVFDWANRSPATAKYVTAFLRDRGVQPEPAAVSTAVEAPPVKSSLQALEALLSRIPPASGPIRVAHRRASAALGRLRALSAAWPAESPEDYRQNLAMDVASLESALGSGDADALGSTLQAVAEDLEVKLEHCTRSGGKLGGSVAVRVRTVQGVQEARSWQVFYLPKVFEASPTATPDLFPQLSSPTEELLVPGRYIMWVRNPATARLGERTVVKVGEGRKELIVDLPVPPDAPQ
jgi:hypothetical protein